MASRIQAWSRRPVRVARSGAASSALASSSVRKVTMVWSPRLAGMARTLAMSAVGGGGGGGTGGGEGEGGVGRGWPGVAGRVSFASFVLDGVEERRDQRRVEP